MEADLLELAVPGVDVRAVDLLEAAADWPPSQPKPQIRSQTRGAMRGAWQWDPTGVSTGQRTYAAYGELTRGHWRRVERHKRRLRALHRAVSHAASRVYDLRRCSWRSHTRMSARQRAATVRGREQRTLTRRYRAGIRVHEEDAERDVAVEHETVGLGA
eukprot:440594-Rhodomonas_salina.2